MPTNSSKRHRSRSRWSNPWAAPHRSFTWQRWARTGSADGHAEKSDFKRLTAPELLFLGKSLGHCRDLTFDVVFLIQIQQFVCTLFKQGCRRAGRFGRNRRNWTMTAIIAAGFIALVGQGGCVEVGFVCLSRDDIQYLAESVFQELG